MGLDPLATQVRTLVKEQVKRGRLKRAFEDEFAARIEQAFLSVTEGHARRALAEERAAVEASLADLPPEVAGWLMPQSSAEAAAAR
jgi:hypothetical protein